jgi:hypothetical protein
VKCYEIIDGVLHRNGIKIAYVNGAELKWIGDGKRYAGPAYKYLADATVGLRSTRHDDQYTGEPPPLPVVNLNNDLRARYKDYNGPIDPQLGDLTPQFAAWLHAYYPMEASVRYADRVLPLQTSFAIRSASLAI